MLALPNAARACSNAAAAYERISDYLRRPAHMDKRLALPSQPGVIEVQQLPVGPKTVLPHWRVEAGSLWVLLGPVGSFKSSILDILAGHGNVADGASVRIGGTMSYAPQVAWIQQATIKSNIVCSEDWNQSRYQAVLHACALEHDLTSMPMRDETIVAEKGLNLSGGQRQRLALARAVYREADIYLLDNPVSAIDDQTQEHIWKHLIEGLLRDSTVIVASSRPVISCSAILHLSPEGLLRAAEIVEGWSSAVHSGKGLPHRYSKSKSSSNAQELHSSFSAADSLPSSSPRELAPTSRSHGLNSAFVENAVCDVSEDVKEYETFAAKCAVEPHSRKSVAELMPDSRLDNDKRSILLRSNSDTSFSVLGDDARTHSGSFLQHLKNKASRRSMTNSFRGASLLGDGDGFAVKTGADTRHDSISSSKVGIFQFMDACQPRYSLVLLAILYPAYQLLRIYIGFWSGFWQRASFGLNNNQFQVIFGGFALALMVVRLMNDCVMYKTIALPGITRVRKAISDAICNAPMSFFMTENLGKIATVYSRDLVAMSETFVDALHFAIVYVIVIISIFLRMMYEIPFSAIPLIPACAVGVWILLQYAKKIKTTKIEFQEADDDVFRALCNAIEGVKVIRTADATDWALEQMAAAFRNWRVATVANDRVAFWLFARMEPLAHILALTTCILSTQLETGKSSGVSLSLEGVARRNMNKQALSFLIFLSVAVKRLSLVYAGMTSVEKVFKYIQDVPRETSNGLALEESWPSTGELELNNLCLKYSSTLPNALNNVNLKLAHGSKVGICGRTGCGKSSLFVALFRLVQPHHGDMLVAGRSILNVEVGSLRRRMSIIPQDPVMFGGTLRENIDPLALYADAQVQVKQEFARVDF
jgi:ABC-type multidrug transport system fused ATPase/permease subunit